MSRILKRYKNKVSQPYKGNKHYGIDIIGDNGKKDGYGYCDYIVAHSNGEVVTCVTNVNGYKDNSYGNYVIIKHDNGMRTLYAHLKYGSVIVKKGMKVLKGEVLGYMGNTGYSFGAHLHFEVRDTNNKRIDPTPYIDSDLPNIEVDKTEETDLLLLVKKTIRGDFGSGEEREKALGKYYDVVQDQVNLNYQNGTTRWDNVRLY